jgi:hypothetical protein
MDPNFTAAMSNYSQMLAQLQTLQLNPQVSLMENFPTEV